MQFINKSYCTTHTFRFLELSHASSWQAGAIIIILHLLHHTLTIDVNDTKADKLLTHCPPIIFYPILWISSCAKNSTLF